MLWRHCEPALYTSSLFIRLLSSLIAPRLAVHLFTFNNKGYNWAQKEDTVRFIP